MTNKLPKNPAYSSGSFKTSIVLLVISGIVSLLVIGPARYGLTERLNLIWFKTPQKTQQSHSEQVENFSQSHGGPKKSPPLKKLAAKHPNPTAAAHREDTPPPKTPP